MIRFAWPALWLLAIPAGAALWRLARGWGRATAVIRTSIVLLLIAALTGVQVRLGGQGTDVVVVVDRSASMTERDRAECNELIATLIKDRRQGDRLGVVTFGKNAQLQQRLTGEGSYGADVNVTPPDGTDLAGGLEMALALIDRDRPSRVLVLSDGQSTGGSPLPSARRAAASAVPIDYRIFDRPTTGDIAVSSMQLPSRIDENEPFQFSAVVHSDRATEISYTLKRPGSEPIRGKRQISPGANRLVFRDAIAGRGVVEYQLSVDPQPGDKPENNTARGVVHVKASPALLLVNNTGKPDNLSRAMAAGQLKVDLASAESANLSLDRLAGYRGVILENASANDLGPAALRTLRTFVTDMGGGLMVTGGQRSFGAGGYYLSELDNAKDPVLPVSMELRREHRKLAVAMAIVMDRSGSMSIPVGGGRTKMDLANLGASEVVTTLSEMDQASIVAVDSSAHIIVPLTTLEKKGEIISRIRRVESAGGGIFVFTGLVAGGKQLEKAASASRHLILFADANDSEEPEGCEELLKRFEGLGITVSVIGLGTEKDQDVQFLRDVARRGHGHIMFTDNPNELPRLFKQDTVTFAPSTFVSDPTPVERRPDLGILGDIARGAAMPELTGFNLTYLRPGAMLGYQTKDEYSAPVVAFWQRGLGRSLAVTFEADGKFTGPLAKWKDYGSFFVTAGRWLLGRDEPDGVRVTLDHRGGRGVVRMELDPERVEQAKVSPVAHLMAPGEESGAARRMPLRWLNDSVAEAEFELDQTGTYQAAVSLGGDRVLRTGAMCLPYSPEFAPRTDLPSGRETLASVAAVSGGKARLGLQKMFEPTARRRNWVNFRPILLLAALLLMLAEIAGRRLSLWNSAGFAWAGGIARRVFSRIPRLPIRAILSKIRLRPRREPGEFKGRAIAVQPGESPPAADAPIASPAPPPPPKKDRGSPMDRAKRRARRDYGR
ncbi:MAG: VWA domain-containing protein [Phycisphaerae bacterium]|nr:VWA domain-containing protein [Phycisphaerae bacterium]